MPSDASNKERFVVTTGPIIPRVLVIIFSIALICFAGAIGMVVYKQVPVEIWGMKVGSQRVDSKSSDIPFLVTEVQQLKEQSQLLEKRLVKLLKENELQKIQLEECKGNISLNSND
ncbi:MAG: hypothetical protein NPINA01_02600 [Nitrospinaceae bacterium]|nr:MAG: hypothetical protein NPINA01_02600 [Nitrospinaceae bacterium]